MYSQRFYGFLKPRASVPGMVVVGNEVHLKVGTPTGIEKKRKPLASDRARSARRGNFYNSDPGQRKKKYHTTYRNQNEGGRHYQTKRARAKRG